ncbi:hypothetical protein FGSG_11524 [Fusarium graminearum PH-1]|uniref:hypothetical protein n=1 Tax=Gibberella zeae (strain ATCC MYA-4620 / CBS 123657 / FGSC 9075 / NRRL 31084 / PH-1) TaxID=229533 RepID=UPI000023CE92|nr:hypothetical protein FGSG_11524 [Fusarium graminearum PH-1]ESU08293.1 hypothetical protein FGSG_11524 [Fusarium graminearum PH-1]EYB21868.1 hypothetical protein FG05_11524 [Fusarium graminearum]|eukprot:XP_011323103.1 hypothetical protein FGSG_11524 [Fusarium graminearum PH-1]
MEELRSGLSNRLDQPHVTVQDAPPKGNHAFTNQSSPYVSGESFKLDKAVLSHKMNRVTDVLRNVLLISSLHYAWNKRPYDVYKLYQHIVLYRDSHLNGLMLYLDATRQSLDNDSTASKEAETEMIDRYIILVCNFVQSQKSRVDDFLRSHDIVASPFNSGDPLSLIHKWHHQEETGPEFRLRTVSMMPFFFAPTTWDIMPADIDARAIIDALKQTTYLHGLRYRNALADTVTNATWKVWKSGSALKLFSALINGHMEIFPDVAQSSSDESQDDEGRPVLSSWSGLCVGVGMYLATVLGMSNRGLPPVTQLHHHTLNILKRDMERGLRYLDKMSEEEQDLWFWKAFTGSLSLMHAQSLSYSKQLDKLLLEFTSYLRIWVARLGVTQWEEARTVLMRTAWPAFNFHDIKGN